MSPVKLSVNFTEFIKFESHSKLPLNFTEFVHGHLCMHHRYIIAICASIMKILLLAFVQASSIYYYWHLCKHHRDIIIDASSIYYYWHLCTHHRYIMGICASIIEMLIGICANIIEIILLTSVHASSRYY